MAELNFPIDPGAQTPVNIYGPDSTPESTDNNVTYEWDGEKWVADGHNEDSNFLSSVNDDIAAGKITFEKGVALGNLKGAEALATDADGNIIIGTGGGGGGDLYWSQSSTELTPIDNTKVLKIDTYAKFGAPGDNCINKFRGTLCGFDVGTSSASGAHDLGRMRYDTGNNTWALACNRTNVSTFAPTLITFIPTFYSTGETRVNGANIGLHHGTRNEPTFIIRNSGNKAYFMVSNASTSLNMSWNSLRPYTLDTVTGYNLWGTEGRFQTVCRVGDSTLDTSGNSSGSNGLKFDSVGRLSIALASTTSSDPCIRMNRKRTTTGRFMEFKIAGNYGAHIAASSSSKVTLYGFSNSYRSGFDVRDAGSPTPLLNAVETIKQLNPIQQGFNTAELRQVVPEAVYGEENDPDNRVLVDPVVLIPHLTKALKEALSRIEVLEQTVAQMN